MIAVALLVVGATAALVLLRLSGGDGAVVWAELGTADVHSLAFDPDDPDRLFFGHHGGLLESRDGGRTWQPTALTGSDAMNVRVADCFREAVRSGAVAIILCHNHPSGDPEPSPEDVRITAEAVRAGELLGVEVLDHVVVAGQRHVSLRERGLYACPPAAPPREAGQDGVAAPPAAAPPGPRAA